MFKRLGLRLSDDTPQQHEKTSDSDNLVQPTVQDGEKVPDTATTSGDGDPPAAKRARFELGPESHENSWDLPDHLLEYIHKYMYLHVKDKNVDECILKDSPIPNNVRKVSELDSYIKNLLQDNSKCSTLKQERALKFVQEKLLKILGPFSQLWVVMDDEKDQSPDDEHVEQCSRSFDQSIMLIAQVFNSLSHHRRDNILTALMDSPVKVKEILNNQTKILDSPTNQLG